MINDPIMANFRQFGFRGGVPKPYTVRRLHDALQRVLQECTKGKGR
jgi:hypothetical protein